MSGDRGDVVVAVTGHICKGVPRTVVCGGWGLISVRVVGKPQSCLHTSIHAYTYFVNINIVDNRLSSSAVTQKHVFKCFEKIQKCGSMGLGRPRWVRHSNVQMSLRTDCL